ncbi:MAG: hypothetical protein ACP5NV_01930 [Candidatus Woesearchaeota archaeon]
MRRIIIIGTLHAGLTPKKELEELLTKQKPSALFVEIHNSDIISSNLRTYPSEMVYALKWGFRNNIPVMGFDSRIKTLRRGLTEKDNLKAISDSKNAIGRRTWKDMNNKENLKILDRINGRIIDPDKNKKRNREMLDIIKSALPKKGNIVIVTGCSHLDYFNNNIKDSKILLRKK